MAGELVTGPGLVQWGSTLLGRYQAGGVTTPYRWKEISGWQDTPTQDSGTVQRAQQHGAWPGRLYAQSRIITIDKLMVRGAPGQIGALVDALETAFPIGQDTEQPLVIQLDERAPRLVNARVLRFALPVTPDWRLGLITGGAIQFEATDPRRYSLTEQALTTGLPSAESGLAWGNPDTANGLAWGNPDTSNGLAWGVPGSSGDIAAANTGRVETHPVIQFQGPCTTPSLTIAGTTTVLEYGVTLTASDVLTVDTWAGTATLGGQDRLGTATARSVPEGAFTIPPGGTPVTLSFRSADVVPSPAASCTVRWRSAYW